MPRDIIEVAMNKLGVVSNMDAKDLPVDYSVYNKNIDPVQIAGRLRPIKTHSVVTPATNVKTKTATKGVWLQNRTELTTLLYTDGTNLEQTNDWYNAGIAEGTQVQSALVPTSMEVFNKEAHLGNGTGTPKWAGFIQYKQFGGSVNDALQIQDAECTIGEQFQALVKAVADASYVYGVSDGGKFIYKFNLGTGVFIKKSEYLLDNTISICIDGTNLWLLHKRGSTYYVSKFTNDLVFVLEAALSSTDSISGTVPPTGAILSDIEKTTNSLWISAYDASNPCPNVWKFTRPTTNATITLTDMKPHTSTGGSNGQWESSDALIRYASKPLVQFSSTSMCLAFSCTGTLYDNSSNPIIVYGGLLLIDESYVPGPTAYFDGSKLEIFGVKSYEMPSFDKMQFAISFGTTNQRLYVFTSNGGLISTFPLPVLGYGIYAGVSDMTIQNTNGTTTVNSSNYILPINTTGTSITVHLFNTAGADWSYKVNSSTANWGTETSVLRAKIDITFKDMTIDSSGLLANKAYFYAVSYVFDDMQHSPLSTIYRCNLGTVKQKEVTIKLRDVTAGVFNKKRVTAVNLYRAENDLNAPVKETLMRFVTTFDIRESFPLINSEYFQIVYIDDGLGGATFEAMTEFPEELKTTMVNHYFSTTLGGYRYIAKCTKTELPDASQIIFRSKLNAYDTFDWTTDLLRVPYVPLAIKGFNNRLFVFFENLVIRLNPDLYPEEDYQGIGIYSGLEPLITDEGMFWMDANGIYYFDGSKITDISIPIKDTYNSNLKSYKNTIVTGTQRCMAYSPEKKSILFSALNTTTGSIWAFHFETGQWYYWEHTSVTSYYMFNGRKSEVFLATTGNLRKMFDGSTYEASELITRKYDYDSSKQRKKWYKVKSRSSGTVTFSYASDDGTSFTTFTENLSNLAAYNLQIKVVTSGDSYLDSLEIIGRRMVGYR
jgi:hypothetical protein